MAKRFAPIVQRPAVRMLPQVRRNELARIKSAGSSMKSQKTKKFKISKGGSASKYINIRQRNIKSRRQANK